MNTIHVNFMTRTFGNPVTNGHAAGQSGKSMADAILEAQRRSGGAGSANESGAVTNGSRARARELYPFDRPVIQAMTMDEYKEYIRDRILALPMHASHMQDIVSVHISDEGFAAMKDDADYEAWVLNDLRTAWTWENPWARFMGGAYSVIHYGATKEECRSEMWTIGFRHGNGKSMLENLSGDKDDKKRKSEIVVRPDGTRYLVVSKVIGGMKVTVMKIKLSEPDELLQKDTPDTKSSVSTTLMSKGGI